VVKSRVFLASKGWGQTILHYMPILDWLPGYRIKKQLRGDLLAGITVAVMTIPQGMAYASLALLPPIYGLYGALVPFFIYPIFGSSEFAIMGLVAVKYVLYYLASLKLFYSSLLTGNSLSKIYTPGSREYIDGALIMSFYAGVFSLALGLLKFGRLFHLLKPSLLLGFTSGTAVVIIMSQLEGLFGVKAEKSEFSVQRKSLI
jgi:SulP family sulfate permease